MTILADADVSGQYIQRVPNRRGYGGCVAAMLIVVVLGILALVILLPSLPGLVMGAVGFRPVGQTSQAFAQTMSLPRIQPGASAGTISIDTGPLDTITLEGAQNATVDGTPATIVQLSESQVNSLCRARSLLCSSTPNPPVYDIAVDLRPGGAVLRGMVYVAPLGVYQPAGLVVRFSGSSVSLVGVDYDGTLYTLPESGLGMSVAELQQRVQDTLRDMTAQAGGEGLRFAGAYATDTELTLVFR